MSPRAEQLAEHVMKNAAVLVVEDLLRRIDPHARHELDARVVAATRAHRDAAVAARSLEHCLFDALDVEGLFAGDPEAVGVVAGAELQGEDSHADEVRAVDALVAL